MVMKQTETLAKDRVEEIKGPSMTSETLNLNRPSIFPRQIGGM
jgi:hypothetical protein